MPSNAWKPGDVCTWVHEPVHGERVEIEVEILQLTPNKALVLASKKRGGFARVWVEQQRLRQRAKK